MRIRTAIVLPLLYLFPKQRRSGFLLIFTDLEADRKDCLRALETALSTVERTSPRLHRQLKAKVRRIVVWGGVYAMADGLGGIHIPSDYLTILSPEGIAGILVHELTHLRISSLGVDTESKRARVEHACVRQQAAFLRLLGEAGVPLAEEFEAELATEWWTDEAHNAHVDQMVARGVPRWIGSLLKTR